MITDPSAISLLPTPEPCMCLQPQPSPEPRSLSPKINSTIFKYPKFNNFVLLLIWGPEQTALRLPSRCHCLSSQPQSFFFARNGPHCSGTGSCQDPFSSCPLSPAPTLCCHPSIQTSSAAPGSLCPCFTIYRQEGHLFWKCRADTCSNALVTVPPCVPSTHSQAASDKWCAKQESRSRAALSPGSPSPSAAPCPGTSGVPRWGSRHCVSCLLCCPHPLAASAAVS